MHYLMGSFDYPFYITYSPGLSPNEKRGVSENKKTLTLKVIYLQVHCNVQFLVHIFWALPLRNSKVNLKELCMFSFILYR